MNQYMEKYPDEIKVGLEFAELIYVYAVGKMDKDAILEALEAKNYYKDRIIEYSKENHIKSLQQYIEINSQISELMRDALTGFKTRRMRLSDSTVEQLLVKKQKITSEQLESIKDEQKQSNRPLQDLVVRHEIVSDKDLTKLYAEYADIPFVEIDPKKHRQANS